MKTNLFFAFSFLSIFFLQNCDYSSKMIDREVSFNHDWKFLRADVKDGENATFDDSEWRIVDLPHDYSIEDLPDSDGNVGPFTEQSAGGPSTGHVLGGTAWYRKHFTLNKDDVGKMVKVLFDGIYMNADVWINGHHLGNHPYGYTAFYYDLTKYLKRPGEENVLAVQVKNEGKNSRWYSGSGIYRNVTLIKTAPVHIDIWGNFVTTSKISDESTQINITSQVVNDSDREQNLKVVAEIKSPTASMVGTSEETTRIPADSTTEVNSIIQLSNPDLWSIDNPNLYTLDIKLYVDGNLWDQTIEVIGIRTLGFSAEKGFLLNGKNVLLKGACMHHDNGILGSAAFDRAEFRKVKIMKENGYNAIRTSHNPPSKAFLDACDQLGVLVIDESFDQWQRPKNPDDYNLFFDDWWEKDMESMLLRDRNHPSIIMWSFGNEISERADSSGLVIAQNLIDKIHSLDPTRPATQAICKFWEFPGRPWKDSAPAFELLDVHGYNYAWEQYIPDFEEHPNRIMYASESVVAETFQNWQKVKEFPYVIGDFVWTGMDYFGESGLGRSVYDEKDSLGWMGTGEWPWYNAYCGDIDVLGNKKPQKVYKDVVWNNSNLEMVVHEPIPEGMNEHTSYWGWPNYVQSWSWDGHEGETLDVLVYSNYDEVRLELNGKEIGTQKVSDSTMLIAKFEVPYASGEVVTIGLKDGVEQERKSLKTVGAPYQLRVTPERSTVAADIGELAYFNVEVLDESGLLIPHAEVPVEFSIQGKCKLQAVGNGNPTDMYSFQQPKITSFKGRCQLIVRACEDGKEIVVTARSGDLKAGFTKVILE